MLVEQIRDPYGDAIRHCQQLALAGDFSSLEGAAKKLLKSFPKDAEARHLLGIAKLRLGAPREAARLIRKAAKKAPKRSDILANLGVAEQEAGDTQAAIRAFRAAIKQTPDELNAVRNLAALLRMQDANQEAIAVLRSAVEASPGNRDLSMALAEEYLLAQEGPPALEILEELRQDGTQDPILIMNLGAALSLVERHDEAIEALKAAIELMPDNSSASLNLSIALKRAGREEEMVANIDAVDLTSSENIDELGTVAGLLMETGDAPRAKKIYHRLVEVRPEQADFWTGLGNCYKEEGHYTEALQYLKRSHEIEPKNSELMTAFGELYFRVGDMERAEAAFRQAFELRPDNITCYNNLIMAYNRRAAYDRSNLIARMLIQRPNFSSKHIVAPLATFRHSCDFEELAKMGDVIAAAREADPKALAVMSFNLMPSARSLEDCRRLVEVNRRWAKEIRRRAELVETGPPSFAKGTGPLRIGILSSDLRSHSVAKYAEPLIRLLDREKFELYAYTPYAVADDSMQEHLRPMFKDFVVIGMMSDKAAAERIRQDKIDILIDFNGLTRDTRVTLLAHRAAPVQCTWLGYPLTTGMEEVDYFLVDRELQPSNDELLVETAWPIDESWLCSLDFGDVPVTPVIPARENGYITFGTLNNVYKFTPETIETWAKVLLRVPDSKFLVVQAKREHGLLCQSLVQEFGKHGVAPERLLYLSNEPGTHLDYYNLIDLSLDTFPLTGGTTTNEALWMGVPVVSLCGAAMHQRISHAILCHAGVPELSVQTEEDFVEAAVALANNLDRLQSYRETLRDRVKASPLRDEAGFARRYGEALEKIAAKHGLR